MKISICGQDRTSLLLEQLKTAAATRTDRVTKRLLSPSASALSLRDTSSEAEFLPRYIQLLRIRYGLNIADVELPARPGLVGGVSHALKGLLWRLLRHQHQLIASQQSLLNELLVEALEFQQRQHRHELDALSDRVQRLEAARKDTR